MRMETLLSLLFEGHDKLPDVPADFNWLEVDGNGNSILLLFITYAQSKNIVRWMLCTVNKGFAKRREK